MKVFAAVVIIVALTGALAGSLFTRRDRARKRRERFMSDSWLREHARADSIVGWEGPRWRFPAEVDEMSRREEEQ